MQEKIKISKYLSLLLRHNPENLDMDSNGWVSCDQLIDKLTITFSELEDVIKTNNKKRFSFNQDKSKVRANQGHSLSWVNVDMDEIKPPDILYHGTATRFVSSIKENGLIKGNRNHVHLSDDLETAKTVGSRHGEVFLFEVDAKRMYEDGYKFYLSQNGVWLIEYVPKEYLFTKPITRFCFD